MSETTTRSLEEVLASIAVPGTDPTAVTEYVVGSLDARRRRVRAAVAMVALLAVLAGGSALALSGDDNPDEIVATAGDRDDTGHDHSSSTTSRPGTATTESTAPPSTGVAVPSLPALAAIATPGAPTPTPGPSAPPVALPAGPGSTATTAPPADRPVTGRLVVTPGAAGDLLDLRLEWNDPDRPPGGSTDHLISTNEPAATTTVQPDSSTGGGCTGGSGASGVIEDSVQFASTGRRSVTVSLHTCLGPPTVFTAAVQVTAPRFADGPGRAVMAGLPVPPGASGSWEFDPDQGDAIAIVPTVAKVTHPVLLDQGGHDIAGYGTVLVVPADTPGTLRYRSGPTAYSGEVTVPAAPDGTASLVELQLIG